MKDQESVKAFRKQLRPLALIPAFGLLLIGVIWFAVTHQLATEERSTLESAIRDAESFALAFEQNTVRALKDVDRSTLLVKYAFEHEGRANLQDLLRNGLIATEGLNSVNVTNAAGDVVSSSREIAGTANVASRDFFQALAAADSGNLEISKPFLGRISGKTSIAFARRLNLQNGAFGGIVVIGVNPEYFTKFYQEADLGKRGALGLLGLDNTYRAYRAGSAPATTPDGGNSPLVAKAAANPVGSFEGPTREGGVTRLVAYRRLADYPLVVLVGQDKQEVLADFNHRRATYLTIATATTSLILIFFTILTLLAVRLKQSQHRAWVAKDILRSAADSSLDAFYLLRSLRDASRRLIDFQFREVNVRGASLLGLPRDQIVNRRLSDLSADHRVVAFFEKYARVVDAGEPLEEEFKLDDPNLPSRWFDRQVVKVRDGIAITIRDITDDKRREQEIQSQRAFLQDLIDNVPIGISVRSMKPGDFGRHVVWNESNAVMFRVDAATALQNSVSEIMPPQMAARIEEWDRELLASPMAQEVVETTELPGRGQRVLRQVRAPMFGIDGAVDYVVTLATDITSEQARTNEIRLASKVFETTADAVVLSDADDRIIAVNQAFSNLTGFASNEVLGKILAESPFHPIDLVESQARMEYQLKHGHVTGEVTRFHKDGSELILWVTASYVYDERGNIVNNVRVFTDISRLKESQKQLEQLANFDTLTGLPNRRLFHDRIEQALRKARRNNQGMGLLFLDLDGFKTVNDTFGHDVGDLLLKEVVARLQASVRSSDSLCRLGGDEFTIVLEDAKDAVRVAERIMAALADPVMLAGEQISTAASIGIALYPRDGSDVMTLIKHADVAMYQAKSRGRSRYEFFSPRTAALGS